RSPGDPAARSPAGCTAATASPCSTRSARPRRPPSPPAPASPSGRSGTTSTSTRWSWTPARPTPRPSGSPSTPAWTPARPPATPPAWVDTNPTGAPPPDPWHYTNTPNSGIQVQLASFNQLQQVAIVNGVVGLAAANNSATPIPATRQVGWGEPIETP